MKREKDRERAGEREKEEESQIGKNALVMLT